MSYQAIAVFHTDKVDGEVVASTGPGGVHLVATFTKLPPGLHGFHIHKAGDLRGEGCQGLCEHYDIGNHVHGGSPTSSGERHTGDLGNIELKRDIQRSSWMSIIPARNAVIAGRTFIISR